MKTRSSIVETAAAVLELTASQRPELMDFQLEALNTSRHGMAVYELASAFGVRPEFVGRTVLAACGDLDSLEKARNAWREPGQILEAPNIAALRTVCEARLSRVPGLGHRRRLAVILRKIGEAQEFARVRGLIESFIEGGPDGPGMAGQDGLSELPARWRR